MFRSWSTSSGGSCAQRKPSCRVVLGMQSQLWRLGWLSPSCFSSDARPRGGWGRIRSPAGVGRRRLRAVGDRGGETRLRSADRFVLRFSAMGAPVQRALGTFADQPSRVSEGGARAPLEKLVIILLIILISKIIAAAILAPKPGFYLEKTLQNRSLGTLSSKTSRNSVSRQFLLAKRLYERCLYYKGSASRARLESLSRDSPP